jgi:carbonic anhydrase/acetyltransferase-like protein (isoleucine patch superfamily)
VALIKPYRGIVPRIHPSAFIAEDAVIIGDVEIGEDSSVWYGCVLRGDVNYIRVGDRSNVQDGTVVHVSRAGFDGPTIIGNQVTIGHGAMIHGCKISDGALIGIGATVLDGAEIGGEALIAAGSLVPPNAVIPPRVMVMGSPAKVRRDLSPAEVADLAEFWKSYVDILPDYR